MTQSADHPGDVAPATDPGLADRGTSDPGSGPADWSDPAWHADVRAWVEARLAEHGLAIDGPIEQPHVYLWATAMRVPTTGGVVWFKACLPTFAPELAILPVLVQLRPDLLARTLASDRDRAWMLTWDAGMKLRERAAGLDQLPLWERILPEYARLQIAAVPFVDGLLADGVPDHRTRLLPEQARALAADDVVLTETPEEALTASELEAFRGSGLAELGRLCAELVAAGIPDTVQHDDLHDGNVLVDGDRLVLFDWGDGCIAHPFHTIVVTLRSAAYKLGLEPGGAEVLRMRDAYLEPWAAYGSRAELIEIADLARRTGTVARALAWWRFLGGLPVERRAEFAPSVPYGIRMFLTDRPWGAFD